MNDPNDFNNPNRFRRRRVTYRPSRAQAGFSTAVGVIFVLIGVFVAIPQAGAFGILWTLIAVGITAYSAYTAFGRKYIGPEINIEDETGPGGARQDGPMDIEQRLTQLSELRDKGLITDAEYEQKRREILDEL